MFDDIFTAGLSARKSDRVELVLREFGDSIERTALAGTTGKVIVGRWNDSYELTACAMLDGDCVCRMKLIKLERMRSGDADDGPWRPFCFPAILSDAAGKQRVMYWPGDYPEQLEPPLVAYDYKGPKHWSPLARFEYEAHPGW